jgi:hypothetical protein
MQLLAFLIFLVFLSVLYILWSIKNKLERIIDILEVGFNLSHSKPVDLSKFKSNIDI